MNFLFPILPQTSKDGMDKLKDCLEEFLAYVPLQLPQLLDVTEMIGPHFNEYDVLLEFPISNGYDIEEVMDMLEDDMEMIILYHHVPSFQTDFKRATCAYSNPNFGQMFKINASTDQSGLVRNVMVTIYSSMEIFSSEVCNDLALHEQNGTMKYKRPKEEILLDFL